MAGVPVLAALTTSLAPVHINVGGTTYISTLETLTKFPQSKLAKLFNGTLPITVDPITNSFFLDRDGKSFRHIVNYLRNSKLVLPENFNDIQLLLEEAKFFELDELSKALTDKLLKVEMDPNTDKLNETENNSKDYEEQEEQRKKRQKRREKQIQAENSNEKNIFENLETQLEKLTELMVLTKDTYEKQIDKLAQFISLCTGLKPTAKQKNKEESDNSRETQFTQENKICDFEALKVNSKGQCLHLDSNVETNLTQLNVKATQELVHVMTRINGDVEEIWSSSSDLSDKFPSPKLDSVLDLTCFKTVFKPSYCKEPILSCSYTSMWFPCLAKYLFYKNYKLVSTFATVDTFNKPCLYYCFVM